MTTFRLVEKIGEGSYSKVYKAVNQSSLKTLAVKIIPFKNAPRHYVQSRQIKILRECNHPNIAPLLDYITTEKSIYLVFQYFQMNLSQYYRYYHNIYNRKLDENQIKNIMIQICSALQYLHSKGIMHRDLKPENIMINPLTQHVKLIDFGFAKELGPSAHTAYMVTRWYRPLQIVLGLSYDHKIDVFAAGAIFLELLKGEELFQSSSNMDQLHILLSICGFPSSNSREHQTLNKLNISNSPQSPQITTLLRNVNDQVREVLISTLNNSPQKRPSIDVLLNILIKNPLGISGRQSIQENISVQPRRRAHSLANGLTVVSIAFSSREKSGLKDERQSLTKDSKRSKDNEKVINQRLYRIVE